MNQTNTPFQLPNPARPGPRENVPPHNHTFDAHQHLRGGEGELAGFRHIFPHRPLAANLHHICRFGPFRVCHRHQDQIQ